MSISATDVRRLRDESGAGMMDCKKALGETGGNFDGALKWLREKGMASAGKRAGKAASEGAVTSYIHMGGKIGVLVEINCETDFVARGELFQQLCKEICLQICSHPPRWVRREEVPQDVVDAEMDIYKKQAADTGKPANVAEKIAQGKMNKFYEEFCLLDQISVRDSKAKIHELVSELSGKIGEKIDIRRFARFQLGEGIEKQQSDLAAEVAAAIAESKGN